MTATNSAVGARPRVARARRPLDLRKVGLSVLIFVVLGFLVVLPVWHLVMSSLSVGDGALGLGNYIRAYGRARYIEATGNSLLLGIFASLLCAVLALPMAWGVSRTNMPAKWLVWLAVLGAFIMPPYLLTVGWILMAGPNAGWVNTLWRDLTGMETPLLNIYSFEGMVLVVALNAFPFVFLFTKSALDMISSELEEAASILGARPWLTSIKVTLPLVWPSIIGGMIIVFLEAIALLGVPALLGIPAGVNVVSTQLLQFFNYPIRIEVAAAYSIPLLLVTVALIYLQKRLLARKGFVTQSGKGGERRILDAGPAKWLLTGWALLVGGLAFFLPCLMMLAASLTKVWSLGFSWSSLTLDHYADVLFHHSLAKWALLNSLKYGLAAALIACVIAILAGYAISRKLIYAGNLVNFLCMAPFVIPGIVLAIGFYAGFATPPIALYGTASLMILAFAARFLPIAYGTVSAGLRSINPEMEEAVWILGGNRFVSLVRVILPLLKKTLFGALLLVFIPATRELSAAIFLVAPNTRVASVLIFDMTEEGQFELVSALGTIMLAATLLLVGLGFKLVGRDFMTRTK